MYEKKQEIGEEYMDLFEYAKSKTMENESPLASRLRPTRLEEVVGQQLLFFMARQVPVRLPWQKSSPIPPVLILPRSMPQWQARRIWKKW